MTTTLTPSSAPRTGWSQSGKLHSGSKTDQVTLQVVFPYAGDFTVEFNATGTPANANQPVYPEALINWVVNGNIVTRRVTIGDGTSVTGVGESVRVIMTDNTPQLIGPDGVSYGVSCQVSMGTRGGSKQPPFWTPQFIDDANLQPTQIATADGDSTGGGTYLVRSHHSINVSIPQDAGAIMLFATGWDETTQTLAAGEVTIQMFNSTGGGFTTKIYDPFVFNDWVPIVPGTDTINIGNASAHNVIVSLAVGIDG